MQLNTADQRQSKS